MWIHTEMKCPLWVPFTLHHLLRGPSASPSSLPGSSVITLVSYLPAHQILPCKAGSENFILTLLRWGRKKYIDSFLWHPNMILSFICFIIFFLPFIFLILTQEILLLMQWLTNFPAGHSLIQYLAYGERERLLSSY